MNEAKVYYADEIEVIRSSAFMWGYLVGGGLTSGLFLFLRHFGVL